jgi:hypothetical protein
MKFNLIALPVFMGMLILAGCFSPKSEARPQNCSVFMDAQNTNSFQQGIMSAIASRSSDKSVYCYKLYNGQTYLGEAKVYYTKNPSPHTDGTIVSVNLTAQAVEKNSVRLLLGNDNYVFAFGGLSIAGHESKSAKFSFWLRDEPFSVLPPSQY